MAKALKLNVLLWTLNTAKISENFLFMWFFFSRNYAFDKRNQYYWKSICIHSLWNKMWNEQPQVLKKKVQYVLFCSISVIKTNLENPRCLLDSTLGFIYVNIPKYIGLAKRLIKNCTQLRYFGTYLYSSKCKRNSPIKSILFTYIY